MTRHDFAPIADSLRAEVERFYRERDESLSGPAGINTLETNSGFVERRGEPLLEILRLHGGVDSIAGLRLLDLGCGFGALSVFFAARGATVTGIDPNEERLTVGRAVAAEHGLPVELHQGRLQALALQDASFDLAVQNNVLCYVVPRDERGAALAETLRVLEPGGSLVVRNPNRWNPLDQFTGLPLIQLLPPAGANRTAALLGRSRSKVRITSSPEAVRELRGAGFTDVRHASPPNRKWPALLKAFARYQHLIARRPD